MVLYGTSFPIQKGKWRVIQGYISSGHFGRYKPGSFKRVRRRGLDFNLDLTDCVAQWIYLTGFYEREDYLEVLRTVRSKPGCVVFDVGAQIGFYSLGLAQAIDQTGSVHCFEPNPASFVRLQRHVFMNGCENVVLNQVALGAKRDRLPLRAPEHFNTGGATLISTPLPESWRATSLEVDVLSLDDYCCQNRIEQLDFVKIDCQGYEPFVLQGGENVLRTLRPRLLVEFERHMLASAGWTGNQFLGLLRQLNFQAFRFWKGKLVPIHSADELEETCNLHCIPGEQRATSEGG